MERQTTLYLRKMPDRVVREAKAVAARQRTTLSKVVTDALERSFQQTSESPLATQLEELKPEQDWYEKNRKRLLARFNGQYIAVKNTTVLDHDKNLGTLARRVYAKVGQQVTFMTKVSAVDEVLRFRSPRLPRDL